MLGLIAWIAVPALAGWQATVITSGSMGPVIRAGDVVVSRPYDGGLLHVGSVVTFRAPGGGGLVTHRVVERQGPQTYRTKGDANAAPDSTLLSTENVGGVGRYRVPAIGLPTLWVREGSLAPLLALSFATTLLVAASCRPVPVTPVGRRSTRHRPPRSRRSCHRAVEVAPAPDVLPTDWPGTLWTAGVTRRRRRLRHRLAPLPATAIVVAVGMMLPAVIFASAALAGTTAAAGTWSSDALDVPQDVTITRNCLDAEKQTTVSWSAVSSAGGADGYDVYRRSGSESSSTLVAELAGLDTTNYSHGGTALDATSYYVVHAASRSTTWRSAPSAEVESPSC